MKEIPEEDDDPVEDVESVADVAEDPVGGDLEHHLDGEDDAEGEVADLDGAGEEVGLLVVLDAHAEGVDEDAEEDEALEAVVVDKGLQVAAELSPAHVEAAEDELATGALLRGHRQLVILLRPHLKKVPVLVCSFPRYMMFIFVCLVDSLLLAGPVDALRQVVCGAVLEVPGVECDLRRQRRGEGGGERQQLLAGQARVVARRGVLPVQ